MYLNRLYYCETALGPRVWRAVAFGAFVFLFLLVFRPFGLEALPQGIVSVAMGYGLTCTIVMLLLNVALVPLMPRYFDPERYTVGHELAWSVVNIALIGIANAFYSAYIGIAALTLYNVLMFGFYTLSVGVFPVGLSIVLAEARLRRKYSREADQVNRELESKVPVGSGRSDAEIVIPNDTAGDSLVLPAKDLLFARGADNYVEVHFLSDGNVHKTLLRTTLKQVERAVAGNESFFRCHKSYFVNLDRVYQVSGNAQGQKLHLRQMEDTVPVSRQHNTTIRKRLTIGP